MRRILGWLAVALLVAAALRRLLPRDDELPRSYGSYLEDRSKVR